MLRRIGLSNFKCWKELDIELAPITLLFGVNSSGKTSLLQSLLLLKQSARAFDQKRHMNFGGGDKDYADFGSYHDTVHGHEASKRIGLSLTWEISNRGTRTFYPSVEDVGISSQGDYSTHASLRYEIIWGLEKDLFVDRLGYFASLENEVDLAVNYQRNQDNTYEFDLSESFFDGNILNDDSDPTAIHNEETLGPPGSCYIIPYTLSYKLYGDTLRVPPFFFNLEFEELMGLLYYLGPLRQYPRRYYQWTGEKNLQIVEPDGADTIATLVSSERHDRQLKQEVAKWLRSLDLIQELEIRPTDRHRRFYEVTLKIDDVESALLDVGFGVSQVLPVVTLILSAPKGSIVLLEQPELHLHPNAQAALADMMLDVAEKRNLQLIVESHSEHIVRRIQRRIAEASPEFATPENIKMYYCQPGEGGATIEEVDVDRFGQIVDWPEKFMGDISGDIHSMAKAAIQRRQQELERVGSGG